MSKFLLALALSLSCAIAVAGMQSSVTSTTPVALFSPVPEQVVGTLRQAPLREGERRRREVDVRLDALGGRYGAGLAQPRLELTFFPGETRVAVLDRLETTFEGRSWIGHLEGVELSSVILTVTRGVVAGSVSWPGDHEFRISPAASGTHAVTEVDGSRSLGDDVAVPSPGRSDAVSVDPTVAMADDPSVLDILFIYTPEVGREAGSGAAVAALLDQEVSYLNVALASSGVGGRARRVGTLEIPFAQRATCGELLASLRNTNDGQLDEVVALRNAYGADLVHLFVYPTPPDCGGIAHYANQPQLSEFGLGISFLGRTGSGRTFAHEVGHNLGARHDWFVDDVRDSAKGFAFCAARWMDIMAYPDECVARGVGVSVIRFFSNPGVQHQGQPIGVRRGTNLGCRARNLDNPPCDADSATTIAESFAVVANHRASRFVATNFPPRNEAFDFRAQLEAKYRDHLRRPVAGSFADPEGAVVWTVEYLRYRLSQCSHEVATDKVRRQVRGQGLAEPCGTAQAAIAFPPRDQTYDFRLELERIYRDDLRRQPADTRVDPEGDVVWIQEYLRYRLTGCSHPDAVARSLLQVDGLGIQPQCR